MGLRVLAFLCSCLLVAGIAAQDWIDGLDPECPFTNGTCPVTKDNVLDVFFFDVMDRVSCQTHCKDIEECHFFTQFGVDDEPMDHTKCFLFKTCDHLEPCRDCQTGPEDPPIYPCLPDNYICGTELDNIVDVFYFDAEDNFSCPHQCSLLDDCEWWTHWEVPDARHKCFLFRNCHVHEDCAPATCTTGPKPIA